MAYWSKISLIIYIWELKMANNKHRRSVIEAKKAIAFPVFGHAVELWG